MGATVDDIIGGIFKRNWANVTLLDVIDIILKLIQLLLMAGGAVGAFFIVKSGIDYITAFGNDQKATTGKNGLTAAIVGIVLVVLAFTLVRFINLNLVQSNKVPPQIQNPPNMN